MTVATAPSRVPQADRRAGMASADPERRGPSGQALFAASADLLAAARAMLAHADAPDSDAAAGPALACVEASLEALAESARRLGDADGGEWPTESPPRPATRFELLADALHSAARACGDARRVTAANA